MIYFSLFKFDHYISLSLCINKITCKIQESMTLLSFFGYLNLFYNDLTEKIPIRTQLQSLNASRYIFEFALFIYHLMKQINTNDKLVNLFY